MVQQSLIDHVGYGEMAELENTWLLPPFTVHLLMWVRFLYKKEVSAQQVSAQDPTSLTGCLKVQFPSSYNRHLLHDVEVAPNPQGT